MSPAESQYLLNPYETPFADYQELTLQFRYVTLLIAAFPLVPFLALLNNLIVVWVDAIKVCIQSRRSIVNCLQDIDTWLTIFTISSYIGITNSGVLIFTFVEIIPIGFDYKCFILQEHHQSMTGNSKKRKLLCELLLDKDGCLDDVQRLIHQTKLGWIDLRKTKRLEDANQFTKELREKSRYMKKRIYRKFVTLKHLRNEILLEPIFSCGMWTIELESAKLPATKI